MAINKLPSGRYQVDVRDQDGHRHRKSFDRFKDAERWERNTKQEVEDRTFVSTKDIPTFGEVAEDWFAGKRNYRNSSLAFWRNHLDNYLVPAIGGHRLDRIDVKTVERLRNTLHEDGLGAVTVNKILTTGAAVYKFAMRRGLAKSNPFALAERLREDAGDILSSGHDLEGGIVREEDVYSAEEIARLLEAANPNHEHAMFLTAALTGIRHGELLALAWTDLDLEAGKVTIRRSVSWAKAPKAREEGRDEAQREIVPARPYFKLTKPKTRAGVRTIPLAPELVSALRRWKLKCPPNELDLVFPNEAGLPLQRKTVLNALHRAQRRAKLRELDVKALRHSFASLLIAAGRPVTEVQYLMGHANPVITLRVYSHWFKRTETTGVADLAKAILSPKPKGESEDRGHSADTKSAK